MPNQGPFDLWNATRASSLANRIERGLHVMPQDLIAILEGDPDCVQDPLLRSLLVKALRGELRKPKGRPALGSSREILIWCAERWVKEETEVVREEIRVGKLKRTRGSESPSQIAHDRVAAWLPGNFSGLSLRNQISRQKRFGKR